MNWFVTHLPFLGSRFYDKKQETGSPLSEVFKVLWCAMILSCKSRKTSLHASSNNNWIRRTHNDDTNPILQNADIENNHDENVLTSNDNGGQSHNNQRIHTPKEPPSRNNEYNNIFKYTIYFDILTKAFLCLKRFN